MIAEDDDYLLGRIFLSENSDNSVNLAQNLAIINDYGIHGIVLGLETDMVIFLIIGFYGCGIIDKSNNHFAVLRSALLADDDSVAAEDAGIYH